MALLKIYALSLVCAVAQISPFILMCILGAIKIAFMLWLAISSPFTFKFTTARLIINEIIGLGLCGIFAYYCFYAEYRDAYKGDMEYIFLVVASVFLAIQFLFLFIEHLGVWRVEIWNKI